MVLLDAKGRVHRYGHDTENQAANRIADRQRLLDAVIRLLRAAGERGLTDDEGAEMLRRHGVAETADRLTFGRRRNELHRAGLVVKTSERRETPNGRSAIVWRAAR